MIDILIIAIIAGSILGLLIIWNGVSNMVFRGKIIDKCIGYNAFIVKSKKSGIHIVECSEEDYEHYKVGDKVNFNFKDELL